MRSLTKAQKQTIQAFVDEQGLHYDSAALLQILEKTNDYETLWQDMKRYANDYFDEIWERKIQEHMMRG